MDLYRRLCNLKSKLAQAAQPVYDAWDQSDEEWGDPDLGFGGICDQIADAMGDVLIEADIAWCEGGQDGDDHAFIIAYDELKAYVVDIPPGVYERGGGYQWTKLPDVVFTPDDVEIWETHRDGVLEESADLPRVKVDYSQRVMELPAGTTLYHGTAASFDARRPKAYGGIFWTCDDPYIARSYLPYLAGIHNVSSRDIEKDPQFDDVRKSIGLTPALHKRMSKYADASQRPLRDARKALDAARMAYEAKLAEKSQWHQGMMARMKGLERDSPEWEALVTEYHGQDGRWLDELEPLVDAWQAAEEAAKATPYRDYDQTMGKLIGHKMSRFGYASREGRFPSLRRSQGQLMPASHRTKGRVLLVTLQRPLRIYNHGWQREGDLMDVEYNHSFDHLEGKGYDGVCINDYAQSEHYGNFGHKSIGLFQSALKDVTVKAVRDQTHPDHRYENLHPVALSLLLELAAK